MFNPKEIDKKQLAEAGVQYGGFIRKRNPQMNPYIFGKGNRNKIYLIELQKVIESCKEVSHFVNSLVDKGKNILFLSTKRQAKEIVKEQALSCGMPYIVNKWKGGFLTNFREISKKIKELQKLNSFMQKEEFANLIKKDQVMLQRNRDKLQNIYEGVMGLKKMPDALFIIGVNKERTAIREARKMGIPIIGLCNTSSNPKLVDYVIPGNDEGKKSIEFFSKFVAETIKGPEQNEETLVADNNGEGETEVTTAS